MKRIIALFVLLTTTLIYSQSSGITYQAVLYNPSGEILPGNNNANAVLSNKDICLRFSITDAQTSLEYQETQRVTTDEFGMVNLVIGSGNQIGGYAASFTTIVWNSTTKKLQVAIDVTGTCSNFVEISNQNFSAVPFAYASKTAESVSGVVPIVNGGTGSTTVSGAKTNLGLNNVDNTSDANKPISNATQTALNLKENAINKSTNTVLGTSDVLFPTQNAVKTYVDNQISSGVVDADSSIKGKIKLAGDLGGTADLPTVPGLANKENTIATGTTTQYFRGDKTWQTLDKSSVGLTNVDNTSDANKPVSTATQAVLNSKEDTTNKSFNIALGTSDVLFPTQNAVKTYVDTQITASATPDATLTGKGKIQLAGDLAGIGSSASSPVISNGAITVAKLANDAVEESKIKDGNVTTIKIADNAVTNAKISGVISVDKGGTGVDLSSNSGYVKQATTGANFSTVSTIPVADVAGAVSSVNGVTPVNGNVSVLIGNVYTGNTITPTTGTTPIRSDIYIVSGQIGTPNDNGRTFIYDGSVWHEISTNVAALDNTFVKLSGSTMSGNLVFPTNRKITIDDAPTGSTDVTNKDYVDTKLGGTGTTNFVPKFSAAKTVTDSSIFDNGNVGIGTTTPANKLEITQGTAGNSGLRFTNLTSSSSASTSASKVLGLNSNGDVILTNIPGTQNIVSFSTASPNTGSPVFTPNTPADQSVIYQSATDNSLWTYNGTTYVTYTAPATTEWNLANTTNDAGSNKTSSIWRSGNVGIGTSSPSTTLHVNNSSLATNTVNADAQVFRMMRPQAPGVKWENIAQFNLGSYAVTTGGSTNATSRLDLAMNDGNGVATSNVMTWQANGNVGIGTTAPISSLSNTPTAIQGSNSTNAFTGGFTWSTPGTGFAASFYSQPTNGNGLQVKIAGNTSANNALEVSSGATQTGSLTPLFNVLGNGNVGIGTTAPLTKLIVNDNAYISNIPTTTANLMDNSTFRPLTRFQTTSGINNNAISHYLTTTVAATQAHNYSTGASLAYVLQPAGGNVGIGTTAPTTALDVKGNGLFRNGNSSIAYINDQILFGFMGTNNYQHSIKTRHNSSGLAGNAIDFFVWNQAVDASTGVGTKQVMTLDGNGNVGIGTTAPAAQLHTTGSVRFAGAGTPGAGKVLTSDASGNATWQNALGSTTVSSKTADYTLVSSDNAGFIVVNSATLVTITVPSTLSAGFYCQIIQQGVGQVSVVGDTGVSVTSAMGTKSRTSGSSIGVMLTTSTTAFLSGDTGF